MDIADNNYEVLFASIEELILSVAKDDEQLEWARERLAIVRKEIIAHCDMVGLSHNKGLLEGLILQRFNNLEDPYDYYGLSRYDGLTWMFSSEERRQSRDIIRKQNEWPYENTYWGY